MCNNNLYQVFYAIWPMLKCIQKQNKYNMQNIERKWQILTEKKPVKSNTPIMALESSMNCYWPGLLFDVYVWIS